jgi:hypothetical protein
MAQQLPLIDSPLEVAPRPDLRSAPGSRPSNPRIATAATRGRRPVRAYAVSSERSGALVEIPAADWHIDAHTKEVGLAGVAAARRALAAAVGRQQPADSADHAVLRRDAA